MRLFFGLLIPGLLFACTDKKDDTEQASFLVEPQLLKLPNGTPSGFKLIGPEGATAQSFTPTSIRISLVSIHLQDVEKDIGGQIYQCEAQRAADCLVEVSKLKDLEDALNASPAKINEANYTYVNAGFCGSEDNNTQTVEVTGSQEMGGKTYITDTTSGLKEGVVADATPVTFHFRGCASSIPLQNPISVELSEEQKKAAAENPDDPNNDAFTKAETDISIRLLFDSFNFAMIGDMSNDSTKQLVSHGHFDVTNTAFNDDDDAACKGDKAGLFLCAQRTAVYATDALKPTIERYAIALRDGVLQPKTLVSTPAALTYVGVIRTDAGTPVAAYGRRSVDYGAEFNRSTAGDEDFIGWGRGIQDNGDGSYKLIRGKDLDTVVFPAFKLEDHEGTRELNEEQIPYAASKMP